MRVLFMIQLWFSCEIINEFHIFWMYQVAFLLFCYFYCFFGSPSTFRSAFMIDRRNGEKASACVEISYMGTSIRCIFRPFRREFLCYCFCSLSKFKNIFVCLLRSIILFLHELYLFFMLCLHVFLIICAVCCCYY